MPNIFSAYEAYSQDIINKDETLSTYESDLKTKGRYVKNLVISANAITVLTHPIRLINTRLELKRLRGIKDEYYKLKKSPLVEHFDEESGELDEDLRAAAEWFKPSRMKLYAERNPIYREEDKGLLKK